MSSGNIKVDGFIKVTKQWQAEVKALRQIILECDLEEDFKWRFPCYTSGGNNIVIIQVFKNFCALMFFKGHLLKDSKKVLKAPGENSQTARRFEFTSTSEISKAKAVIKSYIKEAVKIEELPTQERKKASPKQTIPSEFKEKLASNTKLRSAFESLTPGRQRHYLKHLSSAKQSATRIARIEKCIPRILKGLGLSD